MGVRFRLSWVNGWFIRLFARPYISVNGAQLPASWSAETLARVECSDVRVDAFFRYRGSTSALGTGSYRLNGANDATVHLVARNGVMNQTPFTVRPA